MRLFVLSAAKRADREVGVTENLLEKANKLPMLPGVYIMKDGSGAVIYVGKAKLLKNRVTNYFRGEHEPKTALLVSKIADFDVIVAANEFESLVLENSLIKQHQPHYNIKLKDDKGFPFLRLDMESEYPKFSVVPKTANDGAKYLGPFGLRAVTREILETVQKTLKLPVCARRFPRDVGRGRPCLHYHMGDCAGYCQTNRTSEEYRASIKDAVMILDGKTDKLLAELEQEMAEAAEELHFERAAEIRDRKKAIESLQMRQRALAPELAETDVIGFYRGAKCCFTVMHYTEGKLSDKEYELMDEPLESDSDVVSALARQYYSLRGVWPKIVLLPCEIEDAEPLERFLSEAAGHRVYIEAPKRGEKQKLIETAALNAREECLRVTTVQQHRFKTLEWLQKILELPEIPKRIEAFDVSNTGNFGIVAAMTVFVNGRPLKRDYKKFKIKEVSHQDDYHSMREAVERRYKRYLENSEGFENLPDILLIDGGATHSAAAEQALTELGLNLPVYGMVKDDRHRTRALITAEGREIGIVGNPAVFALIGNIQEETHRFAIEYHRSLRSSTIGSELDGIEGIGEKRRNALLKHFKTLKKIKEATPQELSEVVTKNAAQAVYDYFHAADGEIVQKEREENDTE